MPQQQKSQGDEQFPWDFYLFVATSNFGWSLDFFMKSTPNMYLKTQINWLRLNNPDSIEDVQEVYMDQIPFWN
ncbi:hypothetical protein FD13_GL001052 [Levilactobacillus senmaizukei DSM 21775 = NBRC 103853]|uniref:Uncharacterized protein n=1 Tax=Levilactobacillus senmaizukei DSM 21775 = NBRC 103853 TaxID=1423803 RepID=A0A0R2DC56_9LACO|nr:hypothetical protein [Levilactobacillus senmaizukei]KRN01458.1 hypothetical protein FD13_GL001052 [Levilactobacillus senmaizukei DSM 21775 = NBRC 103853]